jgi:hypothetical protein
LSALLPASAPTTTKCVFLLTDPLTRLYNFGFFRQRRNALDSCPMHAHFGEFVFQYVDIFLGEFFIEPYNELLFDESQ